MSKRFMGNSDKLPLLLVSAPCPSTDGYSSGTHWRGGGAGDENELWKYVVDGTTHDPGLS